MKSITFSSMSAIDYDSHSMTNNTLNQELWEILFFKKRLLKFSFVLTRTFYMNPFVAKGRLIKMI